MRRLGQGYLKNGFTVNNSLYTVKIESQAVNFSFDSDLKAQVIQFANPEVFLFRKAEDAVRRRQEWYASVFGRVMSVHFDQENPPYPISYFSK